VRIEQRIGATQSPRRFMPFCNPSTSKTEAKDGSREIRALILYAVEKVNDVHSVEQKSASFFGEGMID
jgi:hypothetical protein